MLVGVIYPSMVTQRYNMAYIAQENPIYQPAFRVITAITNANPCVITTSFAHDYTSGIIVRIIIPSPTVVALTQCNFGMNQINGVFSSITVTGDDTFILNGIDTTFFDTFSVPVNALQSAQCVPIGEVNNTLYSAMRNTLPF